jgi:hypothetical protein
VKTIIFFVQEAVGAQMDSPVHNEPTVVNKGIRNSEVVEYFKVLVQNLILGMKSIMKI